MRATEKLFLEGMANSRRRLIHSGGLKHPDCFYGLAETGRLGREALTRIIRALPEGTSEIMCHPGIKDDALAARGNWGYGWQAELDAVTDDGVKALVRDMGVELVSYGSL